MKTVTGVGLAIVFSVIAMAAQAGWPVYFYVDQNLVAELEAGGCFDGPIKLAGRSGPCGSHERSGLYDNLAVCVFWDAHGFCYLGEDGGTFDFLDTLFWASYGGPSPQLLEDFGNPSPCLMTSGDASYASGLYSLVPASLGWGEEWYFFVDVYVDSAADFHTVELGIADADAPSGPPGQQTLGHVVGVTWTNSATGENVLQCVTDIDCEEVPVEGWIGGWHRIGFGGSGFSPVEVSSWGRVKGMFR